MAVSVKLATREAFAVLEDVDYVFGCLDNDGARLVLNELCAAFGKPYFNLASDVIPGTPLVYGGTICVAWDGTGCLSCRGEIDAIQAQCDLADAPTRQDREAIYGVGQTALGSVGPAVVSINGVVSSYGVTEFLVGVTGLRRPNGLANYRAHEGKIVVSTDEPTANCYYCTGIREKGKAAGLERYLTSEEYRP